MTRGIGPAVRAAHIRHKSRYATPPHAWRPAGDDVEFDEWSPIFTVGVHIYTASGIQQSPWIQAPRFTPGDLDDPADIIPRRRRRVA